MNLALKTLCLVAFVASVSFALTCHHYSSGFLGEVTNTTDYIRDCGNDTYCAKMFGTDSTDGKAVNFIYKGCASELLVNSTKQYYLHVCDGEAKQKLDHNAIVGWLYCCDLNNCNAGPVTAPSAVLGVVVAVLTFVLRSC